MMMAGSWPTDSKAYGMEGDDACCTYIKVLIMVFKLWDAKSKVSLDPDIEHITLVATSSSCLLCRWQSLTH